MTLNGVGRDHLVILGRGVLFAGEAFPKRVILPFLLRVDLMHGRAAAPRRRKKRARPRTNGAPRDTSKRRIVILDHTKIEIREAPLEDRPFLEHIQHALQKIGSVAQPRITRTMDQGDVVMQSKQAQFPVAAGAALAKGHVYVEIRRVGRRYHVLGYNYDCISLRRWERIYASISAWTYQVHFHLLASHLYTRPCIEVVCAPQQMMHCDLHASRFLGSAMLLRRHNVEPDATGRRPTSVPAPAPVASYCTKCSCRACRTQRKDHRDVKWNGRAPMRGSSEDDAAPSSSAADVEGSSAESVSAASSQGPRASRSNATAQSRQKRRQGRRKAKGQAAAAAASQPLPSDSCSCNSQESAVEHGDTGYVCTTHRAARTKASSPTSAVSVEAMLDEDEVVMEDLRTLLQTLLGPYTPASIKILCSASSEPQALYYTLHCWGYETVDHGHLRILAMAWPARIVDVWIDPVDRKVCIRWLSFQFRSRIMWRHEGIYATALRVVDEQRMLDFQRRTHTVATPMSDVTTALPNGTPLCHVASVPPIGAEEAQMHAVPIPSTRPADPEPEPRYDAVPAIPTSQKQERRWYTYEPP